MWLRHSNMNILYRSRRAGSAWRRLASISIAVLLVSGVSKVAWADEVGDVNALIQSAQYAEALSRADSFINKNPRDAQMRFLKGVILAEQNKTNEAISIFTKLTEQFPNMPEPYNNLAVLYAGNGQYEKARNALDAGLRTNPAYATVYENLGDLHARLAIQSYDKALQVDSGEMAQKSRLILLRGLGGSGLSAKVIGTPATTLAAAPAPMPAHAPTSAPAYTKLAVTSPPVAASKSTSVSLPPATNASNAPNVSNGPITPIAGVKGQTKFDAKSAAKSANSGKSNSSANNEADVLHVVNNWAKAWSAQDVKAYLGFYSNDFQTPKGLSFKEWSEERRTRIAGKGHINVRVVTPRVTFEGNTAIVKFRQTYTSDRLDANSRKTLVLIKQGGKWQIKQEQTS